jgi:hypothetical protein
MSVITVRKRHQGINTLPFGSFTRHVIIQRHLGFGPLTVHSTGKFVLRKCAVYGTIPRAILSSNTGTSGKVGSGLDKEIVMKCMWQKTRLVGRIKDSLRSHGSRVHNDTAKRAKGNDYVHKESHTDYHEQHGPDS